MGEAANKLWYGDVDIFLTIWVITATLSLAVRKHGGWSARMAMTVLLAAGSCMVVDYRMHYIRWCPVPAPIQRENLACATELMSGMAKTNITWWVDFGSLLALRRGGDKLTPWDDDFDVSVVGASPERLRAALQPHVAFPVLLVGRDMAQMVCGRVHADVFLWARDTDHLVQSGIGSTVVTSRRLHNILPTHRTRFLGVDAQIPANTTAIMAAEYGPTWLIPRITHRECINVYWRHIRG